MAPETSGSKPPKRTRIRTGRTPEDRRAAQPVTLILRADHPHYRGNIYEFMGALKPEAYEINSSELSVAKSLTKVTTKGGVKKWTAEYKYDTPLDLAQEYAQKNPNTPLKGIQRAVETAASRVVEAYRIAMAVREHFGALPGEALNIERLIRYLGEYTIAVADHALTPYSDMSASTLGSVLTRRTSATLLVSLSNFNNTQVDHVANLSRYLAFQQQGR